MSIRSAVAAADEPAASLREGSRSLVDRHTTVEGVLETPHDLRIEGQVSGTVRCEGVLYIAAGAEIDADVSATDAIVEGTIEGSITCSGRLEIRPTGVVRASVQTQRLVIHEGAILDGRLDMVGPEVLADPLTEATSSPDSDSGQTVADSTQKSSYSYLRSFSSPGSSAAAADIDLPGQESSNDAEDDEEDKQS